MADNKDVRVRTFTECTSCRLKIRVLLRVTRFVRRSVNKKEIGISIYIYFYYSKESFQYTQFIRIEKILSLLYCNKHTTHRVSKIMERISMNQT